MRALKTRDKYGITAVSEIYGPGVVGTWWMLLLGALIDARFTRSDRHPGQSLGGINGLTMNLIGAVALPAFAITDIVQNNRAYPRSSHQVARLEAPLMILVEAMIGLSLLAWAQLSSTRPSTRETSWICSLTLFLAVITYRVTQYACHGAGVYAIMTAITPFPLLHTPRAGAAHCVRLYRRYLEDHELYSGSNADIMAFISLDGSLQPLYGMLSIFCLFSMLAIKIADHFPSLRSGHEILWNIIDTGAQFGSIVMPQVLTIVIVSIRMGMAAIQGALRLIPPSSASFSDLEQLAVFIAVGAPLLLWSVRNALRENW